ncbi:hypothetical protein MTO96_046185 [Rhipicephalus appendiculatus]
MTDDEDGIIAASKTELTEGVTPGKLPVLDPDGGKCDVFFERFECFVAAKDIIEDKQLQELLTYIGDKAYVMLRSLLLPNTPTQTYDGVIANNRSTTP